MAAQDGLDLAGFDAVAADLELVVGAAEDEQRAVVLEAGQVAGAVHPLAGRAVRVGGEPGGGQRGAAQVAAGEARAADVQLAGHAGRDGPQPGVQDAQGGVVQGAPDVRGPPVCGEFGGGGPDGGLGRPVEVEEARSPGGEAFGEIGGERFAAAQHAQAVRQAGRGVDDAAPQRRGGLEVGGGAPLGEGGEQQRVEDLVPLGEDDGGPGDERDEEFQGGDVEADGGDGQQAVPGAGAEAVRDRVEEVGEGPVGDDDALGVAGGAGGVDDVRGRLRVRGDAGQPCRVGLAGLRVQHRVAGSDHEQRVGVLDEVGHPVGREVRVHGDVRRSGGGDREQDGDEVGAAGQGDGDQPFGAYPEVAQASGERGDPGREGGVAPLLVARDERGRVRGLGGPAQEASGEAERGHGADGPVEAARVGQAGQDRGGRVVGAVDELLQYGRQPAADGGGPFGGEEFGAVVESEREAVAAGQGDQHQRVVGGVVAARPGDEEPGGLLGTAQLLGVHGEVLEQHQGVEEFAVPGEPLELGERLVLMIHQLRLPLAQLPDEGGEGLTGARGDPGGDGVDEQADHVVRSVEVGGAAGDGDAERDVAAAGEAQQQAPGGLEHGADGDVVGTGEGVDAGHQLVGERHVHAFGGKRASPRLRGRAAWARRSRRAPPATGLAWWPGRGRRARAGSRGTGAGPGPARPGRGRGGPVPAGARTSRRGGCGGR